MALRVIEKSNNAVVGTPIGTVESFGGSTAPNGWLSCDGSTISRTTYSDLFGVVGTSFGVGDGSTTFNLPDLRGASPTGAGTSVGYTQNETLVVGTKYNDGVQGHGHSGSAGNQSANHSHVQNDQTWMNRSGTLYFTPGGTGTKFVNITSTGGPNRYTDSQSASHSHTITVAAASTLSDGTPRVGSATKGKQLGVNFIIKY